MATSRFTFAGLTLIVATVFLTSFPGGVTSQSPTMAPAPAPAPSVDCFTYIANMTDCLTYVELGSNLTVPDKACCPELAGLVESNPICLCQLVANSNSLGVQIDLSKALNLPSACGVSTPPLSMCSLAGIPIGAPTSSEGPMSSGGPAPGGLTASPSSGNKNDNGASSIAGSALSFLVGLAIAFLPTLF